MKIFLALLICLLMNFSYAEERVKNITYVKFNSEKKMDINGVLSISSLSPDLITIAKKGNSFYIVPKKGSVGKAKIQILDKNLNVTIEDVLVNFTGKFVDNSFLEEKEKELNNDFNGSLSYDYNKTKNRDYAGIGTSLNYKFNKNTEFGTDFYFVEDKLSSKDYNLENYNVYARYKDLNLRHSKKFTPNKYNQKFLLVEELNHYNEMKFESKSVGFKSYLWEGKDRNFNTSIVGTSLSKSYLKNNNFEINYVKNFNREIDNSHISFSNQINYKKISFRTDYFQSLTRNKKTSEGLEYNFKYSKDNRTSFFKGFEFNHFYTDKAIMNLNQILNENSVLNEEIKAKFIFLKQNKYFNTKIEPTFNRNIYDYIVTNSYTLNNSIFKGQNSFSFNYTYEEQNYQYKVNKFDKYLFSIKTPILKEKKVPLFFETKYGITKDRNSKEYRNNFETKISYFDKDSTLYVSLGLGNYKQQVGNILFIDNQVNGESVDSTLDVYQYERNKLLLEIKKTLWNNTSFQYQGDYNIDNNVYTDRTSVSFNHRNKIKSSIDIRNNYKEKDYSLAAKIEYNFGTKTSLSKLFRDEIKGYVFEDLNYNGIKDEGEKGLSKIKVNLDIKGKKYSTWTENNGLYVFEDINDNVRDIAIDLDFSTIPDGYSFSNYKFRSINSFEKQNNIGLIGMKKILVSVTNTVTNDKDDNIILRVDCEGIKDPFYLEYGTILTDEMEIPSNNRCKISIDLEKSKKGIFILSNNNIDISDSELYEFSIFGTNKVSGEIFGIRRRDLKKVKIKQDGKLISLDREGSFSINIDAYKKGYLTVVSKSKKISCSPTNIPFDFSLEKKDSTVDYREKFYKINCNYEKNAKKIKKNKKK